MHLPIQRPVEKVYRNSTCLSDIRVEIHGAAGNHALHAASNTGKLVRQLASAWGRNRAVYFYRYGSLQNVAVLCKILTAGLTLQTERSLR